MNKTFFFRVMLFASILAMTACSNVNDPEPEPTSTLPFSETFETSLGKFTTQSVLVFKFGRTTQNINVHLSKDMMEQQILKMRIG